MFPRHPDFEAGLRGAAIVEAEPVRLPTGRLVAAEPPGLFGPGQAADGAFAETVEPGDYPVEIFYRGDEVIAAQVVIEPGPVREWRPAHCVAHPEWEHCYFPVDGGTGSFGSVEVFELLSGDPEARQDLIADFSFDAGEPYLVYHHPDGPNLVAFSSDISGRFETWVGYASDGAVARFLTDYGDLA